MTKTNITVSQSIVIGSVAGGTEVLVNHPLWSIKTRIQSGDPFTLKPSIVYRGILPNASSMIPITATQVGLNRCVQNVFYKDKKKLSNGQRLTSAFVAGAGSALFSCPTEMVMTYQGKVAGSFYAAARHLVNQGGWSCLYTGLPATVAREGVFTTFFLAVTPILKTTLLPYIPNDYAASLVAGMTAGVGATLASQGVDTIKTRQQASDVLTPVSLRNAINKLYSTHGAFGFFKGGIPRGARVISAVTIMGLVNEKLEARFSREGSPTLRR